MNIIRDYLSANFQLVCNLLQSEKNSKIPNRFPNFLLSLNEDKALQKGIQNVIFSSFCKHFSPNWSPNFKLKMQLLKKLLGIEED